MQNNWIEILKIEEKINGDSLLTWLMITFFDKTISQIDIVVT